MSDSSGKVEAAIGQLHIKDLQTIEVLNFEKGLNEKASLKDGSIFFLKIDRDLVRYDKGEHPYVTIIAYDATGYPLKQRRKSVESEKVTTLSFWGIPQKCEVIIKNKIESEILSFRIKTKKSTVNAADEEKFLKVHRDRSEIG